MQQETKTIIVTEESAGSRLDQFLAAQLSELSRTKVKELILSEQVTVNATYVKPKFILSVDDTICVQATSVVLPVSELTPVKMDLDILYEDEDLVVINKPVGLVVHPGAGTKEPTLIHGLLAHCAELSKLRQEPSVDAERPGIVHRLDKDTSGVMVCAKNLAAHTHLAQQFKDKTNERLYTALVSGTCDKTHFTIESYLGRDPKHRTKFKSYELDRDQDHEMHKGLRHAKTEVQVLAHYAHKLSLCRIKLFTGRTHQIRVHMASIGHPVVGDQLYGRETRLPLHFAEEVRVRVASHSHQLLHAKFLAFTHPRTNKRVEFSVEPPQVFADTLSELEAYKISC